MQRTACWSWSMGNRRQVTRSTTRIAVSVLAVSERSFSIYDQVQSVAWAASTTMLRAHRKWIGNYNASIMQRDKVVRLDWRDSVLGKGARESATYARPESQIAALVEIHSRLSSFCLASLLLISASCFTATSPQGRISTEKLEDRTGLL